MRWNWMGQLFGQSLQHGANWKGMSAAGAGAGAGDGDAGGADTACAAASNSAVLRPSRQSCDGGAPRAFRIGDTCSGLASFGLLGQLGQLGRWLREERRERSPKGSVSYFGRCARWSAMPLSIRLDAEVVHAKPPNAPPAAHPWPRDPGSCSSPCCLLGSWENLARCPRDFDKMSERCPDKLQRESSSRRRRWPCPFPWPNGGQGEEISR
jgi:hypothetical protein